MGEALTRGIYVQTERRAGTGRSLRCRNLRVITDGAGETIQIVLYALLRAGLPVPLPHLSYRPTGQITNKVRVDEAELTLSYTYAISKEADLANATSRTLHQVHSMAPCR